MKRDPMKRHVRLRDLDTLLTVIDAGGMRKGAARLHLSQPAVSKAVRSLEDALGVPLLERGRRGVEPTKFGAALTSRARAAFDELRQAIGEIEYLADPQGGELRFGAMETMNAGVVGLAVEQMSRQHARMRFLIQPGSSLHLIEHCLQQQRSIEFAIVRPPSAPLPAGLVGEPLMIDPLQVVVGVEHRYAKRRRITLAELASEHWITSEREATAASPLGRACAANGIAMPTPRLETDSIQMRLRLLDTAQWVTLMPRSLLHFLPRPRLLRALPIELPPWELPNMIVTNRGRVLSPLAQTFLDTLRTVTRTALLRT